MQVREENFKDIIENTAEQIFFDSVIESLFEGVVISDNKGKIVLHNTKFREIWKIPEKLIETGNPNAVLRHSLKQVETPQKFYGRIRKIWVEENKDFGLINLHDGRIIEYFATPLIQCDVKIGFIGIFRDITEKTRLLIKLEEYTINLEKIVKQRTEQINNLNKQLKDEIENTKLAERMMKAALESEKEVSKLKSGFISSASHEFKTPLTTILSSVDLMDTFWENQNYTKFAEHKNKIKTKVHSLIKLIDDVLVVHQIEKNVIKINNEEINLKEVVDELMDEVRIIDMQNHNIIFNYDSEVEFIESDPKIFRHIIGNLLINAVKYTPSNGNITMDISLRNDVISIAVKDEGPGIEPESLKSIFEPFERGQSARDKEGAGLGLSIVKYTLDLCGGTIEVASKKNKGTSFFVTIPLGKK